MGVEHRVRFPVAAPVAMRMLQAQQPVRRLRDDFGYLAQADVHTAVARLRRLRGRRLRIPWKCTHRLQTLLNPQALSTRAAWPIWNRASQASVAKPACIGLRSTAVPGEPMRSPERTPPASRSAHSPALLPPHRPIHTPCPADTSLHPTPAPP